MECFSCFKKQKFIIHGSQDVDDDDGNSYVYTQYTCQNCNTVHEVYEPCK